MEFRSNLYSKILFCIIPTLFHSLTYAKDVQQVKIKSGNTHEAVQPVSKQSRNSHQVYQAILVPVSAVLIIGVFLIVRSFTKADVEDNGNVQEPHDSSILSDSSPSGILNKPTSKEKNNNVNNFSSVDLLSMKNKSSNHDLSDNKLSPTPSQLTSKDSMQKVVQKNVNPTHNSSTPSTKSSKRDQSNSLKLGKHKSFDELTLIHKKNGYAIYQDNTFIATKSCLISEENFWKPWQEKQTIWVIRQRASRSVIKNRLKNMIDHIKAKAPDQSIHINIGGHGNEDGHITYDQLADIKLTSQDQAAIESKKNISLHFMSEGSDATYPKEANHVIDVWNFSLKTKEKKHCQAFKEYTSRREDFFKLRCIKRAFLKGSNIEVPRDIEGLIGKFTGHPLNSITQKNEQAILDLVPYGSVEYNFLTSLGICHSASFIEKELENRYFYQRDNNQLNNPSYYTQLIKGGLFDELIKELHLDSCRLLIGHPSISFTEKGDDFKPDQMIQNRVKGMLPNLSSTGLYIKALCRACKHENWYHLGTPRKENTLWGRGKFAIFQEAWDLPCLEKDCRKTKKLNPKVMAFKGCQYHIERIRHKDQVNWVFCEDVTIIHDRGEAKNSPILKEVCEPVAYREIFVKISDLSNSCQCE